MGKIMEEIISTSNLELSNFECERCGRWFGIDMNIYQMHRRAESKYKNICTKCLEPGEMIHLIKIMKPDDED